MSACFLVDEINIQNYIVTSNYNFFYNSEPIKIFDFQGAFIKEVNESFLKTFFIESYLDYIITGNIGYIKSYHYKENNTYQKYHDTSNNSFQSNFNITNINN